MTSSAADLGALGSVGEALERTVRSGRISPSYLFEADDAADAREAALLFAGAVLGEGRSRDDAWRRRVQSGNHPDLHVLEKDKPTVISVAALAAQLEEAHRTPLEGTRQVFLIDPAEAMEAEGVARYLKALEEPPPGTIFLLVSTRPDRLPQTVLSRVRRVRLPPHDEGYVATRLEEQGVAGDRARRLARWAGGSLGRARRLEDGDLPAVVEALVDSSRGVAARVDTALAAVEREAAARVQGEEARDKRQEVRQILQDLVHVLGVEARDRAAGREALLPCDLDADSALRRLEDAGRWAAAIGQNVTPAVILLEIARRFVSS